MVQLKSPMRPKSKATAKDSKKIDKLALRRLSLLLEFNTGVQLAEDSPSGDNFLNKNPEPKCQVRLSSLSAWNSREKTLIMFDWDDTLCPSSYIFSEGEVADAHALPTLVEDLRKHAMVVEAMLRLATKLGSVYIVTLAEPGWISKSMSNFMPDLQGLFEELDIKIVYAISALSQRGVRGMMANESRDAGQFLKTIAMRHIIKHGIWMNAISVGDSDAEFYGIQDAIFHHKGLESCACKAVKLEGQPDLETLAAELDILIRWLPSIIDHCGDLELDFAKMGIASGYSPLSAKSCFF